jgi:hypothetical protein
MDSASGDARQLHEPPRTDTLGQHEVLHLVVSQIAALQQEVVSLRSRVFALEHGQVEPAQVPARRTCAHIVPRLQRLAAVACACDARQSTLEPCASRLLRCMRRG